MSVKKPQALLFDLGGVLVDIDFGRALSAWAPHSSLSIDGLRQAFKFDLPYEQHERGEITAAAYFDHLASMLKLSATHAEISNGWNSIFVGELTQTRLIVEAMRALLPCHAFTNTNATHMAAWTRLFPGVVQAFDRIFASHEMGLRKPERAAFDHITRAIGVAAGDILFFDDLLENVNAASEAGLQAVHVRSPADVTQALRAFHLALPPAAQ
ncbi:HAD-IA family hydrolase [Aquabacterium sp.]|uniref:HAD-IA family hydrolase n=1 Tax=Aquabacterium sp. TaxID=1872578 RepID=UPI002C56E23C|nr:HAD-IA family hydrolase [Aquabacterium sp.]HSW06330.1 HAD-IA family hydrolase [Aquabacterium sp.]